MVTSIFAIHGLLNIFIFTLIIPIAMIIAHNRKQIGAKWYDYHKTLTLSAMILLTVSITISVTASLILKKPFNTLHKITGLIVVALVTFQYIWTYYLSKIIYNRDTWLKVHIANAYAILIIGVCNIAVALLCRNKKTSIKRT